MDKQIAVLGSTGSIGTQTLQIVRENPDFHITALAAGKNVALLEQQVREFRPSLAVMWSEEAARDLAVRVRDLPVRVLSGMDGLFTMAAQEETQVLVTAVVGMIGIRPTIAAIENGKTIALANKETLVTAGHLIMPLARQRQVSILPVDSEHSAIFQSLNGEPAERVKRILLTASGGPFRGMRREELARMTVEDALRHPNWSMGRKITVDSATMVNKALEVMEARWLFNVSLDQIQVVVHPQSVIHSMVEYVDGAVIAQLGVPDMKLPIQYALTYPDRRPVGVKQLDLFAYGSLTFERADTETFRGLALGLRAAREGGSMPVVFNAANERAVSMFLDHRIGFLEIAERIEACMEHHVRIENPDLEQILAAEAETYAYLDSLS